VIPKPAHFRQKVCVISGDGTRIAVSSKILSRIEAEAPKVTDRPDPPQPVLGAMSLRGILDNDDVIEGIVLLKKGAEGDSTLEAVHAKVQELNGSPGHPGLLPPGVTIVPFLDRSDLVHLTTHTVMHNLTEGIILVAIVLFVFLVLKRLVLCILLLFVLRKVYVRNISIFNIVIYCKAIHVIDN